MLLYFFNLVRDLYDLSSIIKHSLFTSWTPNIIPPSKISSVNKFFNIVFEGYTFIGHMLVIVVISIMLPHVSILRCLWCPGSHQKSAWNAYSKMQDFGALKGVYLTNLVNFGSLGRKPLMCCYIMLWWLLFCQHGLNAHLVSKVFQHF